MASILSPGLNPSRVGRTKLEGCFESLFWFRSSPAQNITVINMTTTTATKTAEIKCVNKSDRQNPHERITHVGGYVNSQWKITQEEAIAYIENGEWKFWVKPSNTDSVWVIVAVSRYGNKYLKTEADGEQPNNLLSLPECP